jgi:hypothetical protein
MSVRLPVFLHGTGRIPQIFLKLLSYVNDFYCTLSTYFDFCLKSDENENLYEYLHTLSNSLHFVVKVQCRGNIYDDKNKERKKERENSRLVVNLLLKYGEIVCVT